MRNIEFQVQDQKSAIKNRFIQRGVEASLTIPAIQNTTTFDLESLHDYDRLELRCGTPLESPRCCTRHVCGWSSAKRRIVKSCNVHLEERPSPSDGAVCTLRLVAKWRHSPHCHTWHKQHHVNKEQSIKNSLGSKPPRLRSSRVPTYQATRPCPLRQS
jgi:hypothetical protein